MSQPSAQAAATRHRPPRYPGELPVPPRTASNDEAALKMAKLALDAKNRLRDKRNSKTQEGQGKDSAAKKLEDSQLGNMDADQKNTPVDAGTVADANTPGEDQQDAPDPKAESTDSPVSWPDQPFFDHTDYGRLRLPLKSMFGETGRWPKKLGRGAEQNSWSNIGFPKDLSLVVPDFEEDTHIDKDQPYIKNLATDVSNIRFKAPGEIADGDVETVEEDNRTIETFKVHGRTVCRVKFSDVDAFGTGSPYSLSKVSKLLERKIDEDFGIQPEIKVERWVMAHILLSRAGQISGRTDDYWKNARHLAQQQLYINPEIEDQARQQIEAGDLEKDPAFAKMMKYVEKGCCNKTYNQFHQSQRNDYAVDNGMLHKVQNTDIVLVLDQSDNIVFFQCKDVFDQLLTKAIQKLTVQSFEDYSTLYPIPYPDMTRHGLHWTTFLTERPDLDFRNPDNDPRVAKSGVFHIGGHCPVGDPNGRGVPFATDITPAVGRRPPTTGEGQYYLNRLRYSAFGACTEVSKFFFELLDPSLLEKYIRVADKLAKFDYIPSKTRRSADPFVMRALLVNLMTYEHRDTGDWHHGFAFLVPVGDYGGGDLVLRELGLQIEAPPGCVQMIRGRELRHSITKWTGRRFVCVSVTHEAVRRWAMRELGEEVPEEPTSKAPSVMADCIDADPEDLVPEYLTYLSEVQMLPLNGSSDEELEGSEHGSSEASLPSNSERKTTSGTKHRAASSSDASAEASDGGPSGAKRQKKA